MGLRELLERWDQADETSRRGLIEPMRDELDRMIMSLGLMPGRPPRFWLNISTSYRKNGQRVKRRHPVWELRYDYAGRKSDKTLGRAWDQPDVAPAGYLTREQAEAEALRFLAQLPTTPHEAE